MAASSGIAGPAGPQLLLPRWAWWVVLLPASGLLALLTLRSVQMAATAALVACVVGVYLSSRPAGIAGMWVLWLVVPGLRRVFDLSEGFGNADPLAIAPFLATGAVGALELTRAQLSRRARLIVFAALAGFLFGGPAGLLFSPTAAVFAAFAYGSAVLAFCIGYREPRSEPLTLAAVLTVLAAPLGVYGLLQVLAPLPEWDTAWLASVSSDFVSIGSKEEGTLRAFSTLNSPGTLAAVLGAAIVCVLSRPRFGPVHAGVLVAALAGLGVTLVRSVWISLAVALLAMLVVAPRRITVRVAVVAALGVLALPAVLGQASTSIGERAQTLTDLGSDTSAQQRIATPSQLVPFLVRQPIGLGLGTAGEATRIGQGGLRATDNALLSVTIQSGVVGLVLVLGAFTAGVLSALRSVRRRTPGAVAVFGCLTLLTVLLIAGDAFYGVTGAIIWYLIGVAVRAQERAATEGAFA